MKYTNYTDLDAYEDATGHVCDPDCSSYCEECGHYLCTAAPETMADHDGNESIYLCSSECYEKLLRKTVVAAMGNKNGL